MLRFANTVKRGDLTYWNKIDLKLPCFNFEEGDSMLFIYRRHFGTYSETNTDKQPSLPVCDQCLFLNNGRRIRWPGWTSLIDCIRQPQPRKSIVIHLHIRTPIANPLRDYGQLRITECIISWHFHSTKISLWRKLRIQTTLILKS